VDVAALIVSIIVGLVAFIGLVIERRDRRSELGILRDQLETQTRADMYAQLREIRWEPARYEFTIGNGGPAIARKIRVWMRAGPNVMAGAQELERMLPGDVRPLIIELGRPLAYEVGTRTPAELMCSWTDDSGRNADRRAYAQADGPHVRRVEGSVARDPRRPSSVRRVPVVLIL
jgi:hypothetical protein